MTNLYNSEIRIRRTQKEVRTLKELRWKSEPAISADKQVMRVYNAMTQEETELLMEPRIIAAFKRGGLARRQGRSEKIARRRKNTTVFQVASRRL